jgi:hypothetical protein
VLHSVLTAALRPDFRLSIPMVCGESCLCVTYLALSRDEVESACRRRVKTSEHITKPIEVKQGPLSRHLSIYILLCLMSNSCLKKAEERKER